jgi:hypothetical protein
MGILGITTISVGSIPHLIGFTMNGIAAFSKAALIQSLIGSVAKGSAFALMQSLAAQGIFYTITVSGGIMIISVASIYGGYKIYNHIYPVNKAKL